MKMTLTVRLPADGAMAEAASTASLTTFSSGVGRMQSPAEGVTVAQEAVLGPPLTSTVPSSRRPPVPAPTRSLKKDGGGCGRPRRT